MGLSDARSAMRGAAAGVLAPFDDSGDLLADEVRRHARYHVDAGIDVVLAAANIAEYHALTDDERVTMVDAIADAVGPDDFVLAGAGGAISEVATLADRYGDAADAIMVMPPDHTFVHEAGLPDYFDAIAAAVNQPLVPYIRGIDLRPETIAAIAEGDRVAAVKYALPGVARFRRAVQAASDDVVWVNGRAEPPAPAAYLEGAEGTTAGAGNVFPEITVALVDALDAGNWERAREIRDATLPFQQLRDETGPNNTLPGAMSVPVLKAAMDAVGLHGGPVRPPLVPITDDDRERVEEVVADLEAFVDELDR
jgi:4-hydroxy-tetrahydrodipicolinate synthase